MIMANVPKSAATDAGKTKPAPKADPKPAPAAASTQLRIPLHDPVPSLFVDGCHGANIIAGCVRLDLFVEHAFAGSKGTQQMVVGRVIVPQERFEHFARGINAILTRLQDDKAAKETGPAAGSRRMAGTQDAARR
jgi:hypothetical protein